MALSAALLNRDVFYPRHVHHPRPAMMTALKKLALLVFALSPGHQVLAALDGAALAKQYFDNDSPWYLDRIPFFEASDSTIQEVYYYRWKIFRSHQRDLGVNGWITTEFIDDVDWQTFPSGSLNDATQFHLNEGRWCRDRRFWTDYAKHMYSSLSNPRHFSENMAASIWNAYLVDGDQSAITGLLSSMQNVYNLWQGDHYDSSKGLFFIEPLADATEYTISSIDASCGADGFTGGDAFRPSINTVSLPNVIFTLLTQSRRELRHIRISSQCTDHLRRHSINTAMPLPSPTSRA